MSRPLLLDLFCGAGGAAMGYHRAGFDVIGVDIAPQPDYPFTFHQGDALEFAQAHGSGFDTIHASPPCHDHSQLRRTVKLNYGTGPLLGETLDLLKQISRPFVVENVDSAAVRATMAHAAGGFVMLCGSMFGREINHHGHVLQMRRHRLFATSFVVMWPPVCQHRGEAIDVTGNGPQGRIYREFRERGIPMYGLRERRLVMGIDWMADRDCLAEAIPPAFTEYIGAQLLNIVRGAA